MGLRNTDPYAGVAHKLTMLCKQRAPTLLDDARKPPRRSTVVLLASSLVGAVAVSVYPWLIAGELSSSPRSAN